MEASGKHNVSISARIEDRGLSASINSRAIAAIDRLIGNFVDIPGNYFDLLNKRIENQKTAERELSKVEVESARKKLLSSDECGERLLVNVLSKEGRRQKNKQAVGLQTIALLDEKESSAEPPTKDPIENDWLNIFEKYAEDASSERMRDLLARVLAGEIRRPRSFSLTTVRFLAEIDLETAGKFERIAAGRIGNQFLPKPELRGSVLLDYTFLEEVGLIQGVHGNIGVSIKKQPDGFFLYPFDEYFYLKMRGSSSEIRVKFIPLTRTGREITSILPTCDYREGAKIFVESLKDDVDEVVMLARPHGSPEFFPIGKLK